MPKPVFFKYRHRETRLPIFPDIEQGIEILGYTRYVHDAVAKVRGLWGLKRGKVTITHSPYKNTSPPIDFTKSRKFGKKKISNN